MSRAYGGGKGLFGDSKNPHTLLAHGGLSCLGGLG